MLQILKDEKHQTTEERLLKYATDSFQRLLPKLQIQVNIYPGHTSPPPPTVNANCSPLKKQVFNFPFKISGHPNGSWVCAC